MKESVWNRIEKTVMCGLTIDKINQKGGSNVNKYLAYMALSNSATDEWDAFDYYLLDVVQTPSTEEADGEYYYNYRIIGEALCP